MSRIVVVGGGPAGMMAAYAASQNGHQVLITEQNEKLGKKLYITGKGRCNVTNASDRDTFFENVVRNPKFLFSSFHALDNNQLISLLEEHGVPLIIERGNRVYPQSGKSSDILRALDRMLRESGVQIKLNAKVDCLLQDEKYRIIKGVRIGNKDYDADAVILATGGKSYPKTGSTGDGYRFAKTVGHAVTPIYPALIPIETQESWPMQLQGLSLKNVTLQLVCNGKVCFKDLGEMLFTHFGVSGPLVLSASSKMIPDMMAQLYVDMKPGLSNEQLDARLVRDFEKYSRKLLKNALDDLLPVRLTGVVIALAGLDPEMFVHQISKKQRAQLVHILKAMPMNVKKMRPIDEAIITRGGVDVKQVHPTTMQSRLVRGLFFAGEILDLDALTGGYNLQIAWSTGYLAGMSV